MKLGSQDLLCLRVQHAFLTLHAQQSSSITAPDPCLRAALGAESKLHEHFLGGTNDLCNKSLKTATKNRQTFLRENSELDPLTLVFFYKWICDSNGGFMDIRHGRETNLHSELRE